VSLVNDLVRKTTPLLMMSKLIRNPNVSEIDSVN
jgi:hypothetical protein